ncbi:MAG TPA: 4Fe-4S binding protein, partial [bacterium]|nr:4Fe-4S binding protein [bacterium]
NCCTCCCGLLRSKYVHDNPNVLNTSGFVALCDYALCTQCGVCESDRCKVAAIEMSDDGPVIDSAKCIGCGLCVTGCPASAMKMIRRDIKKTTAKTNKDMGMAMLMEKNKLQGFMPYVDSTARPNKK